MSDKVKSIISNVLYVAAVLLFSFLIVHFVGQRTEVIGTSMVPTLQDGDQLITDKITYRFREPERFDIIVFPHEPYDEFYIKRIIGMPGETVKIERSTSTAKSSKRSTATGRPSLRRSRGRKLSSPTMSTLSWEITGRSVSTADLRRWEISRAPSLSAGRG